MRVTPITYLIVLMVYHNSAKAWELVNAFI